MRNVSVYVDTNIFSNALDPNMSQGRKAIFKRLTLANINFVTSEKTKQEIDRITDESKLQQLESIYTFIAKIRTTHIKDFMPAVLGNSCLGSMALGGMTVEDPLYCKLKKVFDKDDAEHIYHAIKARCDYFLTLDRKTILKRAKKHVGQLNGLNIKFVSPGELIQIFRKDGSQ